MTELYKFSLRVEHYHNIMYIAIDQCFQVVAKSKNLKKSGEMTLTNVNIYITLICNHK